MRKGGLSGCRKGLKTVPLAQALLSLKPAKTTNNREHLLEFIIKVINIPMIFSVRFRPKPNSGPSLLFFSILS